MFNQEKIKEIIPHRDPFLLVDEIINIEIGKSAKGVKYVTGEEDFFRGHFPEYPVMPGVLIVEALAQVGAVALLSLEENKGRLAFFTGIDNCRFRKQVLPGDALTLDVTLTRVRGSIGIGKGIATIGDQVVCETDIMFALGEKK